MREVEFCKRHRGGTDWCLAYRERITLLSGVWGPWGNVRLGNKCSENEDLKDLANAHLERSRAIAAISSETITVSIDQ